MMYRYTLVFFTVSTGYQLENMLKYLKVTILIGYNGF